MSDVKMPEDYKQTEVGVIPKDWEVEPLKSLLKEPPKYGINAAAVPLTGNLPVYIRITDISEDGYYSPEKVVGVNSPFSSSYILNEGDIVLARTGASVGKSYLYRKEDGTLIYAGFLIKVSPNEKQLNPKYLHQYLKTEQYWAWVIVNSMRSGQPGINGNEYGRLLIPLPSIEEQTAIATALSDVDDLIQSLEKLIAKKEAIKTGTMQQLLTGKTRLPEFATRDDGSPKGFKQIELGRIPDDWEVSSLGELCKYQNGSTLEKYFNNYDGYRVISIGNYSKYGRYIDTSSFIDRSLKTEVGKFVLNQGDLAMILNDKTAIGTIIGRVILIDKNNEYVMNQRTMRLSPKDKVNSRYLHFLINSDFVHSRIKEMAKPGTQIYINTNDVLDFILYLPSSNDEKTAIATILSDMDTEIQALQQRLKKTRDIKQGMMQQLLTGKVRLAH